MIAFRSYTRYDESMWKIIAGYDYEVSDRGQVRRLHGGELKPLNNADGYLKVQLSQHSKRVNAKIHRLVAQAFVANPNDYNVVNHLDGDKTNNAASNLEWTTAHGNNQHAWDTGLNRNTFKQRLSAMITGRQAVKIAHEKNKRKVTCLTNGITYNSIQEAADALGVNHGKISAVASGKRSHTGGYKFAYVDDPA